MGQNSRKAKRLALMMGAMIPVAMIAAPTFAQSLPSGGQVVSGQATISQPNAAEMVVDQSTGKAIITWDDFSIGQGGKVQFNNGSGATLNRVLGGNVSSLDGMLSATGSVYLINPNGVVVGKSGVINTGGTFVASTLNVGDNDFLKGGDLGFSGDSLASVVNLGHIGSLGGDVTLIASNVRNDGSLAASQGTVGLLAGQNILMRDATVDDGKFLVLRGGADTSVTNTGAIAAAAVELRAEGGNIYALAGNTSGVIRADGVTSHDGRVFLTAGAGSVDVSGTTVSAAGGDISITGKTITVASDATLDASGATGGTIKVIADMDDGALAFQGTAKATGANGGGFVETSGASVDFVGAKVDTSSTNGKTGQWLTDPFNLTVDSAAASTIATNLATTNVTLQTTASGTSGPGNASSGAGDISVNSDIAWSSANTLTLDAYHSVNIKANITVNGSGGVAVLTNDGGVGGDYSFAAGKSLSYTGSGGSLSINGNAYTLLYDMTDVASINLSSGNYALARSVTSSGTYTDAVVGQFYGTLTGLGNTIDALSISGSNNKEGLISNLTGTVRDINLTNVSIASTGQHVGALVGWSDHGTVKNASASGTITGTANFVGGLVGVNDSGTMDNVHASGSVTGSLSVGGLLGYNTGTVTNAYATGTVVTDLYGGGLIGFVDHGSVSNSFATANVSGSTYLGGLVGQITSGTINDAYATGSVTAGGYAGGLVGYNQTSTITDVYATGYVTASVDANGLVGHTSAGSTVNGYYDYQTSGAAPGVQYDGSVGLSTADLQSGTLPSGFSSSTWATSAGYYPYLWSFTPTQKISGFAYNSDGTGASGATVGVYTGGALVNGATATSGANGYYYYTTVAGAVDSTTKIGAALTLSGDTDVSGVTYTDTPTLTGLDVTGLDVKSGTFAASTTRTTYSLMDSDLSATFGSGNYATITGGLNAATIHNIFAATSFNIDQSINIGGKLLVQANNGDLSIANGSTVASTASGDAVILAANGSFINNNVTGGVSANNGRWLIYSQANGNAAGAPTGDVIGDLSGKSYYNDAYTFGTSSFASAPNSGNRFVHGYAPTLTVTPGTSSVAYNGSVQTAGVGITGFLSGDVAAGDVTGTISGITTSSKNVGVYTLNASGSLVSDMNYSIAYGSGTMTITQAALTLTAATDTKTYDANATSTGTVGVSGLQGSDTVTGTSQTFDSQNAGSRTLSVAGYTVNDGNSGGNYAVTTQTTAGTINKAALTLTAATDTKTYDAGTTSTGTVGVSGLQGSDTVTGTSQAFDSKNAGSRTLTVAGYTLNDGNAGGNYTVTTQTAAGTINKAALTVAAVTSTKTYDATTASTGTVAVTGLLGSDTVTGASQTYDSKNAGSRTLTVAGYTLNDDNSGGNYTVTTQTAAGSISQKALTVGAVTDTKTYDATTTSTGTVAVSGLMGSDTVTGTSQTFDSKNAGSRTLTVAGYTVNDGNSGGNYTVSTSTASGTINKAALTVAAVTDTKTYDATTTSTGTVAVTGLKGSDTVTGKSQAFDSKNAGTRTMSVTGYTLNDGNSGNNYTVTTQTASGTINKAALTLTAATDTKTYDAATTSTGTVGVSGLKGSDTVTGTSQAFDSKNAGSRTLNVAGYTVNDGNSGGNYTIATVAAAGTINKAALTLTATTGTKTYDATTTSSATGTASGLKGSDTVTGITETYDSKNAGSRTLSVTGYTVNDGNSGGNYTIATVTAAGTINKAALTLTATTDTKTYNGTTASSATGTASGLKGSDTVTGITEAFDSKNAGSRTLNVTGYTVNDGNSGGNYTIATVTASGTINKASLTAALTGSTTKVYDGTTAATLASTNYSLTGVVSGDSVALNNPTAGTYADKNVGTAKNVTATGLALTGTDAGNYTVNASATGAIGVITKATLTLTATTGTKTYDATTASTATATVSGLKTGDTVTGLTETFDSKNAGNRTLSVSGYTLTDGNNGGNYTVQTVTTSGTINKAALTIAANTGTKTYDGSTASSASATVTGLKGTDTVTGVSEAYDTKNAGARTLSVAGYTVNDGNTGGNYTVTTSTAAGTINTASLTVAADNKSKVVGATDPALTYHLTAGALISGDTLSGSLARALGESAGAYAITIGSLAASSNYTMTFVPGTFQITNLSAQANVIPSITIDATQPGFEPATDTNSQSDDSSTPATGNVCLPNEVCNMPYPTNQTISSSIVFGRTQP